ncbi:porin family protein [Odoribacter sp. OttesenSCG-928-J03]|nr:porin family protein [Odoribacter sp. OttesenSCG-928-J03]MDL2283192.1 porin family protein [Odoribacter sp. OttesenSCG-928-G04]
MKKITITLLVILSCFCASAQYYYKESGFLLGVNAEYKHPLGDFGKMNKYSLGVNIAGKYLINRAIGLGFEIGYHPFKTDAKNSSSVSQDLKTNLIPILFETTFYIPTWDRTLLPYLGLHFGGYLTNIKVKQAGLYGESNVSKKINRFAIGIGPHVGLLVELSEFIKLDIKLRGDYVPKIKKSYDIDDYTTGSLAFDKIINIGLSAGLLYTF